MMLAALALAATLAAADPTPEASALSAVEFMTGHWVDSSDGALSEEVWTAPAGNGMLGMWRLVMGGEAKVLELLTLTAEENGVVLRLRHFDGRSVAREEKDGAVALALVSWKPNEAVFEGPRADGSGPLRLTYRRSGDTLTSTLEKDGKAQDFRFTRKD